MLEPGNSHFSTNSDLNNRKSVKVLIGTAKFSLPGGMIDIESLPEIPEATVEEILNYAGIIISFATSDWSEVSFGHGRLERLISPAVLRQESEES